MGERSTRGTVAETDVKSARRKLRRPPRGFFATTFVLGLLLLIPLFALVLLAVKTLHLVEGLMAPLARLTQTASLAGVAMPRLLAITALVLLVFLAGLVGRLGFTKRGVGWLEQRVLSNIPGYGLIKSMVQGIVGDEAEPTRPAVLLRLDDAWQIGLRIESAPDGRVVVFLPDAHSPSTGTVLVVSPDRVQPLDVQPAAALKSLRSLGSGAGQMLGRVR